MTRKMMLLIIAVLVAGAAGAVLPVAGAEADQGTQAPPDQLQGPAQMRKKLHGYRLRQADTKLVLTAEQKKKMQAFTEDERQQLKALREDRTLNKEQKMAKYQQIREATQERIKGILTPEQRQKYEDKLEADRKFRESLRKGKTEKEEEETGK